MGSEWVGPLVLKRWKVAWWGLPWQGMLVRGPEVMGMQLANVMAEKVLCLAVDMVVLCLVVVGMDSTHWMSMFRVLTLMRPGWGPGCTRRWWSCVQRWPVWLQQANETRDVRSEWE